MIRALVGFGIGVLLIAVVVAVFWGRGQLYRPLPQTAGTLTVEGLRGEVEVLRDAAGVPHIYAENIHDLLLAQGIVHAQDRFFQMDLMRRVAAGRLGELVGKNEFALRADILMRTLGMRQVAERKVERMDPFFRELFQAFADGVNAYVDARGAEALALEYSVLGMTGMDIDIPPWTIADSLSVANLLAWDLSKNRGKELFRRDLEAHFGPELAGVFLPPFPYGERPTIIGPEQVPDVEAAASGQRPAAQASSRAWPAYDLHFLGDPTSAGSNNWVVSGARTESGKPLLANDPHLGVSMPSIWYEVGLFCPASGDHPAISLKGMTLPLVPLITIGHNGTIAWGITNGGTDVQDHYELRVNPSNAMQYAWDGTWRDFTVREETLRFADGTPPMTIQIRETHFGPVMTDHEVVDGMPSGFENGDALALRWACLDDAREYEAAWHYATATNWEEFLAALEKWETVTQNFVYADVNGNIGYALAGRAVIRAKGHDGKRPVPGWTSEYNWKGYVPFDYLPREYNPERGWIGTANQTVVPPEYIEYLKAALGEDASYELGADISYYAYRASRVYALLEQFDSHSIGTFRDMHNDTYVKSVDELLPYFAELTWEEAKHGEAIRWLQEWDAHFREDSGEAALWAHVWVALMEHLYNDQLMNDVKAYGASQEMWTVKELCEQPEHVFWNDVRTSDVTETRDTILQRAFVDGYRACEIALGRDRGAWAWGDVHTVTFESLPLGQSGVGPVESLVNRGPYPARGSTETVNRMRWLASQGNFDVTDIASMRFIADMADLDNSRITNSTGQSGHALSPHYDDQIADWLDTQYRTMPFTKEAVEEGTVERLVLEPR